jgi:hypothetical protein
MSPSLCRRQFLARTALLAGAALLLPTRRLLATTASAASFTGTPADAAHRAALALVGTYGTVTNVAATGDTTRIVARIRCFDSMGRALGTARCHGISRIRAKGNVTSFELGGRRFEIENLHHAA